MKKEIKQVVKSVEAKEVKAPKKKQVELSDADCQHLNDGGWSEQAWDWVARRHSFDFNTIEKDPQHPRTYYAMHKMHAPLPQTGGILTSKGNKTVPVAGMRSDLRNRDLVTPDQVGVGEEKI